MNFSVSTIGTILNIIAAVGLLLGAIVYVWTTVRSKRDLGISESEDRLTHTLKELLAAQDQKISELDKKVAFLEGQVKELSHKNGDLQSTIDRALDRYLAAHPDEAMKLAEKRLTK